MRTCLLKPFSSQVTPQDPVTANSVTILQQEIAAYLRLLKAATCLDLTELLATITACCSGGGGGSVDEVARAAAAAAAAAAELAQGTATAAAAAAAAAQAEIDAYNSLVAGETIIGSWLGAPLYRKAIQITAGPNNTTDGWPHGIVGITKVIRMWGFLTRIASLAHIPLPYVHETIPIRLNVLAGDIQLTTSGGNFTAFDGYVILEYTK